MRIPVEIRGVDRPKPMMEFLLFAEDSKNVGNIILYDALHREHTGYDPRCHVGTVIAIAVINHYNRLGEF